MGRSSVASAGSRTFWGQDNLSGPGHAAESAAQSFSERISFLLCNSCYWCATEIGGRLIESCPACNHRLEPLPIAAGELLRFDYHQKQGVRLDFRRA